MNEFWTEQALHGEHPKAKTIEEKLQTLDEIDKASPFVNSKMQGAVQSYDLLRNDKYARLEELKVLLDQNVKKN